MCQPMGACHVICRSAAILVVVLRLQGQTRTAAAHHGRAACHTAFQWCALLLHPAPALAYSSMRTSSAAVQPPLATLTWSEEW
jgi:hypothetical protein